MSARPRSTELRSRSRIVTLSPAAVGAVSTRMSTSLPAILRRMRPDCGRRFSAMERPAMIFTRARIDCWNFFGARFASRNTPSTRLRTTMSFSCGRMWISEAPSFAAWNISELTQRMIGASSLASSMSTSSSFAYSESSVSSCFLWLSSSSAPPRRREYVMLMWSMIRWVATTTGSTGSPSNTATASITSTACGSATAITTRPFSRRNGMTSRWRAKLIGILSMRSTGMSSARGRSRTYSRSNCTASASASCSSSHSFSRTRTSPNKPPSSRCFWSARSIASGATLHNTTKNTPNNDTCIANGVAINVSSVDTYTCSWHVHVLVLDHREPTCAVRPDRNRATRSVAAVRSRAAPSALTRGRARARARDTCTRTSTCRKSASSPISLRQRRRRRRRRRLIVAALVGRRGRTLRCIRRSVRRAAGAVTLGLGTLDARRTVIDRALHDMLALARAVEQRLIVLDALQRHVDLLDQAALAAVVDLRLVLLIVEVRERLGELAVLARLALANVLEIQLILDDVGREEDQEVRLLLRLRRVLEQVAEQRDI